MGFLCVLGRGTVEYGSWYGSKHRHGNAVFSYWEMGLGKGDAGETLSVL